MRYHANKARGGANDAQASLGTLQGLQMKVFRVGGKELEALRSDLLNRTFESYIAQEDEKNAAKARKHVTDNLGKESRKVIETYFRKVVAGLSAAIEANDNARINDLISVAGPRFEQIADNDPTLADFKKQFAALSIFNAKPTAAPAPAAVVTRVEAAVAEVAVAVEAAPTPRRLPHLRRPPLTTTPTAT